MSNPLLNHIKTLAATYFNEINTIRHYLHQHPELSFEEKNTCQFIQDKLNEWNIENSVMCQTGVVALIHGNNPNSKVIALRADIDALPINEKNDVPYKSCNPGIMHACGHDVHTSCLLGAAKILQQTKHLWNGTIKLIFQPGEEKNPGGASLMIAAGVLANPTPQAIIALHVNPLLAVGKLSFRQGKCMASADEIYITIKSQGGHAAAPHLTVDSILVASQIVVGLQQIVSRNSNPFEPTVLSFCAINGGNTTNVIPSVVSLMGTFRAMNETWRHKAHQLITHQATAIANAYGATIDIKIDKGYPVVINNEALTQQAFALSQQLIGNENVEETEMRMGAEDFGFYAQKIPACFYRLGVQNNQKGITHNVHTPYFDIDEEALEHGMASMAWLGVSINV
jgi:hippurate hydrolase